MKQIVDTCVWSKALRKTNHQIDPQFHELLESGNVVLLGPIRQEILCGIKSKRQFDKLKIKLDAFPDIEILQNDYIAAAQFFNQCRSQGVQGSMIDFLIAAVSVRTGYRTYTYDKDFNLYQETLGVKILF